MSLKITSKIILLCFSLVLITSMIMGAYNIYQHRESLMRSIISEKENEAKLLALHIDSKINELKNDVLFLSSTPPIKGIIESDNLSRKDKSTLTQWKDRLTIIFTEMMHAKKDYTQIRFIGKKDKGKELLRVERKGSKIFRVIDQDLQVKGSEEYFSEGISLGREEIYLSEFSANKEFGRVVHPVQMVLRAAVPVFKTRKDPFGIIIININYNKIFSSLKEVTKENSEYFVADQNGNILLHSNPQFNIGNDLSSMKQVKDYMPELQDIYNVNKDLITKEISLTNDKIIVSQKLRYNIVNKSNFLTIFLVVDKDKALVNADKGLKKNAFIILIIALFSIVFAIFFSRFITVPIKRLTDFADSIGNNEGTQQEFEINSNDEIGILGKKLFDMSNELNIKNLALKHQKEALDSIAIVAETDLTGRITYINDKFMEISKYSRNELIGRDHRILNSSFHPKEFFQELWDSISQGKSWHGEIKNKAKDGSFYWVDTTIYPVKDKKGKLEKFVAIRFDITDKKQVQKDLEEATVLAQKAVEAKSVFLANMSHEIRTPLNGVIGFASLLLDEKLPESSISHAKNIKDCSESLLVIINDILDISKIEAGKLSVEKIPFDLVRTLEASIFVFNTMVSKKRIELNYHIAEEVPTWIQGDPIRLRQVLINLIGNAVKFTSKGSVEVFIDIKEKRSSEDLDLVFKVKDSGIGISEEGMSRLFASFEQVDSTTTRKYGGTGLGLSICNKLVSLMGGELWVESKEGYGSEFSFTLNSTKECEVEIEESSTQENLEKIEYENSDKLRILVAEDNQVNRKLVQLSLKKLGFKAVDFVENGKLAVEAVQNSSYDLVFMDIQMPEMDGYQATRIIKKDLKLQIKIIGLSANVFPEDKLMAKESGMDDYLEKPINIKILSSTLKDVQKDKKNIT